MSFHVRLIPSCLEFGDVLFATLSGGYVQCWLCGGWWCVVVVVF